MHSTLYLKCSPWKSLSWLNRPFGPHSGYLQATPAFLLSRPIFYCSLSLQSEVWAVEWGAGRVRGWGGSILSYFWLRRGEGWTGKCPTNQRVVMPHSLFIFVTSLLYEV